MNIYVIWLEMNQAKVFKIGVEGPHLKILKRQEIKHHTNHDPDNHKNMEKQFHNIATLVADADEMLLVGPGLAKMHFKAYLMRHHREKLANAIVGTKTLDHISDSRIIEFSRHFFKIYDLYEKPVVNQVTTGL